MDTRGVRAAPPALDRTFVPPMKNGSRREHRELRRSHRRSASGEGEKRLPHGQDAVWGSGKAGGERSLIFSLTLLFTNTPPSIDFPPAALVFGNGVCEA